MAKFSKARQIIISEIRKLKSKAYQKQREADMLTKKADELQEELDGE